MSVRISSTWAPLAASSAAACSTNSLIPDCTVTRPKIARPADPHGSDAVVESQSRINGRGGERPSITGVGPSDHGVYERRVAHITA